MVDPSISPSPHETASGAAVGTWVEPASLLWDHRRLLERVAVIAMALSLAIAFAIPKRYTATTSIMPPDQQGSGAALLAALASHSAGLGGLGDLAGGMLSSHPTTALYEDLLKSGTVAGSLIDRFGLQHVYRTRYRFSTVKQLAHRTTITDDKKSGVITITVEDTDRVRARDMAQAYLDALNGLLTQTNTSAAHQERVFIEGRLNSVGADLEQAQLALSEFSSKNSTIDIKEQTRGLVDAGARVEGELLVAQAGLESLRQIYGDGNIRVRESEARIAALKNNLKSMAGSSAPLGATDARPGSQTIDVGDPGELYPPLRQIPLLAVPYADLYRRVKVQETVYELLTQEYEMARIEEAKDLPVVKVIDPPGVPEKKSYPHRLLLTLLLTSIALAATAAGIIVRDRWSRISSSDPRKALATQIFSDLKRRVRVPEMRSRGVA